MAYTSNKTIAGLDVITTIEDNDLVPVGDTSDSDRAKKITFANLKTEIVGDDTAFVRKADYDANSILYATTNDTPVALTVGTNTVVGRVAGAITTLAVDSDLSSVSASDDTVPSAKATKTALDLKAVDTAVVHNTGNETVAGIKTFSSAPVVPADVYSSGWNGKQEPAPKDAVYDKIESMASGVTQFATGVFSQNATSTTTTTIAHGLPGTPKVFRIRGIGATGTNAASVETHGVYNGTINRTIFRWYDTNGGSTGVNSDTSAAVWISYASSSGNGLTLYIKGVVTLDGTNATVTWSNGGAGNSSLTIQYIWEAEY